MKTLRCIRTAGTTHPTMQFHVQVDLNLYQHYCKNAKSSVHLLHFNSIPLKQCQMLKITNSVIFLRNSKHVLTATVLMDSKREIKNNKKVMVKLLP